MNKLLVRIYYRYKLVNIILEKRMVTHASILAWRMPWTEESGELLSMGLQRDRHD